MFHTWNKHTVLSGQVVLDYNTHLLYILLIKSWMDVLVDGWTFGWELRWKDGLIESMDGWMIGGMVG